MTSVIAQAKFAPTKTIRIVHRETGEYLHLSGKGTVKGTHYAWLGYKKQARAVRDAMTSSGDAWAFKAVAVVSQQPNSQAVAPSCCIQARTGAAFVCEAPNTTSLNYPADTCAAGAFPFIGTAAHHLGRTNKAIEDARASHAPVSALLKRKTRLVARCAALGV